MAKRTLIQRSRRISPAEKAAYHQLTGAGKSHVKRRFFGLSPDDKEAIYARVRAGVRDALKKGAR